MTTLKSSKKLCSNKGGPWLEVHLHWKTKGKVSTRKVVIEEGWSFFRGSAVVSLDISLHFRGVGGRVLEERGRYVTDVECCDHSRTSGPPVLWLWGSPAVWLPAGSDRPVWLDTQGWHNLHGWLRPHQWSHLWHQSRWAGTTIHSRGSHLDIYFVRFKKTMAWVVRGAFVDTMFQCDVQNSVEMMLKF